ncbi:DsrE family protein [Sulfurimonas sp.]
MKNIFLLLFILFTALQAKEYKAVFDCSSSDAGYIKSRMWLINKTMNMIEDSGDKANFVITLHGGCVAMVVKDYDMIVDEKDLSSIAQAQKQLTHLIKDRDVDVTVCAMSLAANAIDKEDVLEFIKISPNSFVDTIGYQNDGYALMSFK